MDDLPAVGEAVDLLIRGGMVIDPASGIHGPADVAISGGKIVALGEGIGASARARDEIDATGLLVTPGLIDIHTHVYPGCTPLSVDADALAARSGVTTMVDCGSAGANTFTGFRRYVVERSACRILAFLNISVIGLVTLNECAHGPHVDCNAALECIEGNRDVIVGVKVRGSRNAFGEDNTAQPVWMARAAATAAGVPVMMHIGDPPPTLDQALPILRAGDFVTHSYKGQPVTRLVDRDGTVRADVQAARERGVLFDLGHGNGSFSWTVARQLADQRFWPDTISTDVHTANVGPPLSLDMPGVLSRLLHLGMPLEDVIRASTLIPARCIGWSDRIGSLAVGREADVAILALENGEYDLIDSHRKTERATRRLVARHTLRAGRRIGVA